MFEKKTLSTGVSILKCKKNISSFNRQKEKQLNALPVLLAKKLETNMSKNNQINKKKQPQTDQKFGGDRRKKSRKQEQVLNPPEKTKLFPYQIYQIKYRRYKRKLQIERALIRRYKRIIRRLEYRPKRSPYFYQKKSGYYIRLLKKFVLWKKRMRVRFIYKYILVAKQAFLQYYRHFNLHNFKKIYKQYRRKIKFTRFEKFIAFLEFRLQNMLVRLRYAVYMGLAQTLITNGQIRINGNEIYICDFQIIINDLIEISYRGFLRQFFKMFVRAKRHRRKLWYRRWNPQTDEKQLPFIRLVLPGYKGREKFIWPGQFHSRWFNWGYRRAFRSAVLYYFTVRKKLTRTFYIQNNNLLATIIFAMPRQFQQRQFSHLFTKKHLKFTSNFCLIYK